MAHRDRHHPASEPDSAPCPRPEPLGANLEHVSGLSTGIRAQGSAPAARGHLLRGDAPRGGAGGRRALPCQRLPLGSGAGGDLFRDRGALRRCALRALIAGNNRLALRIESEVALFGATKKTIRSPRARTRRRRRRARASPRGRTWSPLRGTARTTRATQSTLARQSTCPPPPSTPASSSSGCRRGNLRGPLPLMRSFPSPSRSHPAPHPPGGAATLPSQKNAERFGFELSFPQGNRQGVRILTFLLFRRSLSAWSSARAASHANAAA